MHTFAVELDESTAAIKIDIVADTYEFDDIEEPDESSEFYDELEEEPL